MTKFLAAQRDNLLGSSMVVILLVGLYQISQSNYLLFHGLAELFSIVVAGSIFTVYWNSRRFVENNYFIFISVAYLFIGLIDLVHILAYKGMGVFPAYDANLPTQLWIAARYLESLSLLTAILFLRRKLNPRLVWVAFAAIYILIISAIFWGFFPDCYIEEIGLTPFKKISEYLISLILAATIWQLYRKKADFDPGVFKLLIASLVTTIFAELAFTFYVSVYGISNFVGHIFKILSFYLIYKALLQIGLTRPYALLFRDLKKRETELQESEKKYYNLFTYANDSIFIIHPESHHILDANENAALRLGYERDELLQMNISDIYAPLAANDIRAFIKELKTTGSVAFEYVHRHKDGTEIPVEVTSRVIEYGGQQVFQSIARDITERKQAEETILANEARYRELFDNMHSGVAVYEAGADGEDFIFIDFNQAGERIENIRKADLIGKSALQVFPGIKEFGLLNVFRRVWKTGVPEHLPVSMYQDSRIVGWRENYVYKLPSGEIVAVYNDLTAQKQIEQERQTLTEQLQHYSSDLEQRVAERTQEIAKRVQQVEQLNHAMTNLLADLKTNQINLVNAQADLEAAHQALKEERIHEQAALLRLSQALLAENDCQVIMNLAVREAAQTLQCELVALVLVDEDQAHYSSKAWEGWPDEMQEGLREIPIDENTAMGHVLINRIPVVVPDIAQNDFGAPRFVNRMRLQSRLIVPMVVGEGVIGGLAVNEREPRQWAEDEIHLLSLIANTTAQALERARLFEQVSEGRQRLQTLSSQLTEAQETEHRRLSRELHDQIGQTLSAVMISLQSLEYLPDESDRSLYLQRCLTATDRAIQQVRSLSLDLRPSVLDDLGLPAALRWFLRRQAETTDLAFDLAVPEFEERLPGHIETICYRVLQEACTNALRHAAATRVEVKVWQEADELFMAIRDDGIGFDLELALKAAKEGRSLGLINMQERVELAGGKLVYKTHPGQGTEIQACLPLLFEKSTSG